MLQVCFCRYVLGNLCQFPIAQRAQQVARQNHALPTPLAQTLAAADQFQVAPTRRPAARWANGVAAVGIGHTWGTAFLGGPAFSPPGWGYNLAKV